MPLRAKYFFYIGLLAVGLATGIMNSINTSEFRRATNLPSNLVVGVFGLGVLMLVISVSAYAYTKYKDRQLID